MLTFVLSSNSQKLVREHNLQKVGLVLLFELLLFYVLFWLFDSPLEPYQGGLCMA